MNDMTPNTAADTSATPSQNTNPDATNRVSASAGTNIDKLVESLSSLGALWIDHGLTAGRAALRTSAKSLEQVAEALGHLAETLKSKNDSNSTRN